MADLAASGVVIADHWVEKNLGGRKTKGRRLVLTLAAQGSGAAGAKITASVLGLNRIDDVSPFVRYDDGLIIVAAPNQDGSEILLRNAASNAPATATGVFHVVVKGK